MTIAVRFFTGVVTRSQLRSTLALASDRRAYPLEDGVIVGCASTAERVKQVGPKCRQHSFDNFNVFAAADVDVCPSS